MVLSALVLLACIYDEVAYSERLAELADEDSDGSRAEFDCDDADPTRYPGADERCNDLDDDCDGERDEGAIHAATWYVDGDGDGAGTTASVVSGCEAPGGYAATGDDCDDTRAEVFPGAEDVPYNGIDEDCLAGDLVDVDGDGSNSAEVGGADCNDEDAAIGPSAAEICLDGLDQDCDGVDLTDCDGDGFDGVAVGGDDCDDDDATTYPDAPEGWHDLGIDNDCDGRIDDSVTESLAGADLVVDGPTNTGLTGWSMGTLADRDGDELKEIWTGAPYDAEGGAFGGAVYLLDSATLAGRTGGVAVADEGLRIYGSAGILLGGGGSSGEIGGRDVVWMSAAGADDGAGSVWAADLAGLSLTGSFGVEDVATQLVVGDAGSFTGSYPMGDQDLDGDGIFDLAVDAIGVGAIFVFSAPEWRANALADADVRIDSEAAGEWLRARPVGDLDGDGQADLGLELGNAAADAVGAEVEAGGAALTSGTFGVQSLVRFVGGTALGEVAEVDGAARQLLVWQYQASIFINPEAGATLNPLTDADFQLFRTTAEGGFNAATAFAWLGGAGPAYLLGAPDSDDGSQRGECVLWQSDEFSAGGFSDDLRVHLSGESAGDRACQAVHLADDYDSDGYPEILIGAPLHDAAGQDSGRVYLQYSP